MPPYATARNFPSTVTHPTKNIQNPSPGHFRRTLPRRQPLRFLLRLEGPPLKSATKAEVHQAIVASCLVSKSVYDERDTKLLLCWPDGEDQSLLSVTVDQSLLSMSKTKVIPSESQVLDALQLKMCHGTVSLEKGLQDLIKDTSRSCLSPPMVVRITQSQCSFDWPATETKGQEGWPTEAPIFLCINWTDDLPLPQNANLYTPVGGACKTIVTLQHWHNLGVLPATLTPRSSLPSRGEVELQEDLTTLSPQPGKDVHLDTRVSFQSRVIGRVRMGHVLFAECGNAKVMCKEQRLGAAFHVVANELHVGDRLYCLGYPGFEYKCEAVIFAQQILAIEPGDAPSDENQEVFQDAEILVMQKPAGKLAWEDNRHRHERGTAMKVDADHLLMAPEIEVSGPAVYALRPASSDVSECTMAYAVLVAGAPENVSSVNAALRPARGKPKEEAETELEILWQSDECSLLKATVKGTEVKSQVCRHLHILGFPVWGDRRFGNQRANLRSRAIFGLARPWCHLIHLELFGAWGGLHCDSRPPAELLRVLSAVGCSWDFPEFRVTRVPPVMDLWHLEHGVSIAYYMATRKALRKKKASRIQQARLKKESLQ